MKSYNLTVLFSILLCMICTKATAHDIQVENADGKTIYYVWTNNNTELLVSYRGSVPGDFGNAYYHGNIVIPSSVDYNGVTYSVTGIKGSAFLGQTALNSVVMPNSITSIGGSAFSDCTSLTSVTIGSGVTSISSSYTFSGCKNLTLVTLNSNSIVSNFNLADIFGKQVKKYVIGNSVTSIGSSAFKNCTSLTSIEIPNSVTSIGSNAFYGCTGLTSIEIPNSVTSIASGTFWNCTGLTSIEIPNSVTSIDSNAFYGCTGLTSIEIPNSVTSIGGGTFRGCTGLTSIEISNSVTSIGSNAFYGCTGLTSIEIPNSVTSISGDAFDGTGWYDNQPNGLIYLGKWLLGYKGNMTEKEIAISEGTKGIADYAFKECSGLTMVAIPNSVTNIGWKAFYECYGLTELISHATTPPVCEDKALYIKTWKCKLFVPKGCVEAYQSADQWKDFSFISDDIPKYKLTYVVDGEEYKSYKLEYGASIVPEEIPTKEGYTFSGWNEVPGMMPAHDVTVTGTFSVNKYKLIYKVDDVEYKSYEIEFGATIIAEPEPTKEGFIFSGWSEIPETMPAHDVMVMGSFTKGTYKLTYMVDDGVYKTLSYNYGDTITPEPNPEKEGYTFSGWSEIPKTMPAHDVTVTGAFAVNKYNLIYKVDGEVYKSYEVEYGAAITPEPEPTKEGYTFSGWRDIPKTMPAHDVPVTGIFSVNKYKLIYKVDDVEYKSYEIEFGATIIAEPEPTKEGFTFSGWSEIPKTMPAHDATVTGTFVINSYKLTYMIDDKVYKETMYEYGATITPELQPEGNYSTFEWTDLPETMPAHDVVVYASYTSGIVELLMTKQQNVRIYSPNGNRLNAPQKGLNIIRMNDGKSKKVIIK